MKQLARQRNVSLFRTVLAHGLHGAGRTFRRWAGELDRLVDSDDSEGSRRLRKELKNACRRRDGISELDLNFVLRAFSEPGKLPPIQWEKVSRWERQRAERLLRRAAKEAHPWIALRALQELHHFIPTDLNRELSRLRIQDPLADAPQRLAVFGAEALPYLVDWLFSYPSTNGTHTAIQTIARMQDPDAIPYLERLARLEGTGVEQELAQAARQAHERSCERMGQIMQMRGLLSPSSGPDGL